MNETIGSKGGHNDRIRTLKITQKNKEKLKQYEEERELKELEKDVRKKQLYTLIKTIPIISGIGAFKLLTEKNPKEQTVDEEKELPEYQIEEEKQEVVEEKPLKPKPQKITIYYDGNKEETVYISLNEKKKVEQAKTKIEYHQLEAIKEQRQEEQTKEEQPKEPEQVIPQVQQQEVEVLEPLENNNSTETFLDEIAKSEAIEIFEVTEEELRNLPEAIVDSIDRIKDKKLLDYYTKELKDIEYELKDLIKEYNELVTEEKDAHQTDKIDEIIDKLDDLISKIEELKDKLKIENLDLYEEKYLHFLIQESFSYFKKGKLIEEIKKTPIYEKVEKKLDELDKKKDEFEKEVNYRRDDLEDKEKDFDRFKVKYSSIERVNQELIDFQIKQERLLRDIRQKVDESTTIKERVETKVVGLSRENKRLLNLLTLQMFLPTPKNARRMVATTAAYLYFMKNVVEPHTQTRKYKVVTVKDYSSSIMDSIKQIEDTKFLLSRTSTEVDNMIREIKDKYSEFIDVIPECKDMLSGLQKIKDSLKEQEKEMNKIQEQQELEYDKNNAKVKTIGEYPVN